MASTARDAIAMLRSPQQPERNRLGVRVLRWVNDRLWPDSDGSVGVNHRRPLGTSGPAVVVPVQGSITRSAYNALIFGMVHRCSLSSSSSAVALPPITLLATLGRPIFLRPPYLPKGARGDRVRWITRFSHIGDRRHVSPPLRPVVTENRGPISRCSGF